MAQRKGDLQVNGQPSRTDWEPVDTALEEAFEGLSLIAYPDPATGGVPWTLGYGHTKGVKEGDTCTKEQAVAWLREDVQSALSEVHRDVKVHLTDEQLAALVDFVFNVGGTNFLHSTLLRKLNNGDYEGAADEFEKWDMAAGKHMAGLLRRRHAEAELFRKANGKVG